VSVPESAELVRQRLIEAHRQAKAADDGRSVSVADLRALSGPVSPAGPSPTPEPTPRRFGDYGPHGGPR
jgi:hypothetical protein